MALLSCTCRNREAFDASAKNLEAHTKRFTLANGARVALLPKKTRASAVTLSLQLRMGTVASLENQAATSWLTRALLERGTKKLTHAQVRAALDRLRAQLVVNGGGQLVSVGLIVPRPQLAEALALVAEVLEQPALDAAQLELVRRELRSGFEAQQELPADVGGRELYRQTAPLPAGHVDAAWSCPLPEAIASLELVTLDQVKAFHERFYGAQNSSIAVVGDFDAAEVLRALESLFGGWSAREPFSKAPDPPMDVPARTVEVSLPGKPSAWRGVGTAVKMTDDSPEYAALSLGATMLGRAWSQQSLGGAAALDVAPRGDRAVFRASVAYDPEDEPALTTRFEEQLATGSFITPEELDLVRAEFLKRRFGIRTDDPGIADLLCEQAFVSRTMDWEEALDQRYRALSAEQVRAALKKYIDPSKLVRVHVKASPPPSRLPGVVVPSAGF